MIMNLTLVQVNLVHLEAGLDSRTGQPKLELEMDGIESPPDCFERRESPGLRAYLQKYGWIGGSGHV